MSACGPKLPEPLVPVAPFIRIFPLSSTKKSASSGLMKSVLALLVCLIAFSTISRAQDREYVVLTGAVSLFQWEKYKAQPHDLWWLNFIRASRLRLQELRASNPTAKITWLVYRHGYERRAQQEGQNLFDEIESVKTAYNLNLVYFNKASEVINYLNNGQPRDQVKIADFEYFGHSNRACWLFDYSNEIDSASKVWLHDSDLVQIHRGIFTRDAFVKSWGCHSGEEYSKKFYAATGIHMWGATGKTQYMTETLPVISTPGGKWVR